jgi:enamine deaminase RidA (YjgF/YER057c/UK114 family)
MYFIRIPVVVAVLFGLVCGDLPAQKKKKPGEEEGYVPVVAPDTRKKKKQEDVTQTLPPPKELPIAVLADTDRLAFQVSPLSSKGLFTPQTREALKGLLRSSHGTIVKLRAFVSGSGNMRRVGELVGEAFTEKRAALPALSVVQVGALPLEGAQVVIETTELDKRSVNPNGIAFLSGQAAPTVAKSLDQLKSALRAGGMDAGDALRVTCFVSSLEEQKNTHQLMQENFPGAVLNYVQMQREPVTPAAACEAVARARAASAEPISFLNPLAFDKSQHDSQIALVTSPKLVITGTQLAFGSQESDVKLAFERLGKALSGSNARLVHVVMSHLYLTSGALTAKVRAVRSGFYTGTNPPAGTMLPFEGLPSLDASFGVDVVAVPDPVTARR